MAKSKPKPYVCPVCSANSCGDDNHVVSPYIGPERAAGDRMKIILRQAGDFYTYDNMQRHEILGLIEASLKEHFPEIDQLTGEIS